MSAGGDQVGAHATRDADAQERDDAAAARDAAADDLAEMSAAEAQVVRDWITAERLRHAVAERVDRVHSSADEGAHVAREVARSVADLSLDTLGEQLDLARAARVAAAGDRAASARDRRSAASDRLAAAAEREVSAAAARQVRAGRDQIEIEANQRPPCR